MALTQASDPIDRPRDASQAPNEGDAFRSPWWLKGSHLQTIGPALFAPRAPVDYTRERWDTPDGDFIDVDRIAPTTPGPAATLVVFHGLESDTGSRYVRGLMSTAAARGWHGIAPHFRGCGGTINMQPRLYHSGDSDEVHWILRRVADEVGQRMPIFVAGVSLGGNMLLKWLGERGDAARPIVAAGAAISAPMDLVASGPHLGRGFNRFYTWMFLRTLKAKSRAKLEQHAELFDRRQMEAARDFRTFDDIVTAPLHGFRDVEDYWSRASSKPWLRDIRVPTLILNARNDPFLPPSALPTTDEVSASVTLELPADGGHVGFVSAGPDGVEWMPRRVVRYLADELAGYLA